VPAAALIVIDMLNNYDHEDADALAESARACLPNIVDLRDRAKDRDDVLLIYSNDNYDAWHSGRHDLIERAMNGKHPDLVDPIAPKDPLPFIPKGRHSVFYQTAMDHLLQIEEVKRVVMVGQVTEQCILYSALDAYLRGYEVVVPEDAVAHIDDELSDAALRMMKENLHAELTPARDVFKG
jgi:nicotinamidase-related amidase